MIVDRPCVFVIDDDDSMRKALERLLFAKGYYVAGFRSAEEFLRERVETQIACLLLDLQLPGVSGLELQNSLLREGIFLPIVFISGHGTVPTAVRAIRSGAVGFLTKPFTEAELLLETENALAASRSESIKRSEISIIRQRFATLTQREAEILKFVVSGSLNKQTASELGIVTNTVKVHRRRVMRKMHAQSLAELVVMAQKLKLLNESSPLMSQPPAGPSFVTRLGAATQGGRIFLPAYTETQ